MLKKNEIIRAEIESVTNLGFGVARKDGVVIFVSGAVTKDVADIKIIKTLPGYAVGRVEKFEKMSPYRTFERCQNNSCFGCAYKSIIYEEELKIKKSDVESAFKKAGIKDAVISEVTPSPKLLNYRNKAQYPITKDKNGEYIIGFYMPKSHTVKEARCCPLSPVNFPQILDTAAVFFKKHAISVYDEKTGCGLLRHIYLRRGEVSGEVLLTLVINGDTLPASDEFVNVLTKKHKEIVGVLLNINKKNTNVILGEKFITLFGRDYIYDTLCGVKLKISAPSFYQVNHDAAELLYRKARELANPKPDDILLDLYCGAGSIGLSMADSGCTLYGIEIIESAVECAALNASQNGFSNAKFYAGDAKNSELLLAKAEAALGKKIHPNTVILDPPRAGCDGKLISYVSSLSPERIVYISCNPSTLARDISIFNSLGYKHGDIYPYDLFPATGHVESVVRLERRLDNELPLA